MEHQEEGTAGAMVGRQENSWCLGANTYFCLLLENREGKRGRRGGVERDQSRKEFGCQVEMLGLDPRKEIERHRRFEQNTVSIGLPSENLSNGGGGWGKSRGKEARRRQGDSPGEEK